MPGFPLSTTTREHADRPIDRRVAATRLDVHPRLSLNTKDLRPDRCDANLYERRCVGGNENQLVDLGYPRTPLLGQAVG